MLIMPSISSVFFTSSLSLFLRWPFIRVAQRQRLCKRPPRGLCSRSSISQDCGRHGYWVLFTALQRLHTHPFNSPLSGTTRVSRYQKGKTNLDITEARDSEWQWHHLGHMQVCTSLRTDNHASTPPLSFYRPDALPAAQPTASKHWRPTLQRLMIHKPVQSRSVELLHGRDWKNPGRQAPLHSAKQTDETPLVKICNHPK